MELSLDNHDPLKSTFTSTHDNIPLYKVDKHSSHIEVYKLVDSNEPSKYTLMTQIELHLIDSDTQISLWGREIKPLKFSDWTG
jgi:hypothetical protein